MSSPETRPTAHRPRRRPQPGPATELRLLARRVHFLAGLVVAPFVLVLCVTGLIYAFSPQIHDNLYHRQLYANAPISTPRPVAEQVRAALTAHPEGAVREVVPPPAPGRTTRVVLSVPDLAKPGEGRTVFVDPYTNFINGELTTLDGRMPANVWLRELHSNLRLGEPGRAYAELAATWLPVVTLGGLVVWLAQPRRRGKPTWRELLVPGASTGPAEPWWRMRALHGPLGVWLTVGALAVSMSGLAISEHAGGRADQASDPSELRAPQLIAAPPPDVRDPAALPPPESTSPLPPGRALPPPGEVPLAPPGGPETVPPVPPGPSEPGSGAGAPGPQPQPEPQPGPEPPAEQPEPSPEPSPPVDSYEPVTDPPTSGGLPPLPLPQLPLPDVTDVIPDLSDLLPDTRTAAAPASTAPASTTGTAVLAGQQPSAPISVDQAIDIARAQGLRGELAVTPPHITGGLYTVAEQSRGLPLQRDSVAIDAATGEVTERLGWADYSLGAKLTAVAAEFHTGTLFGLPNQVLLSVLAIGLIVLIVLGYRMWWVHNPYRGRWASLPPPVWRQLSWRSLALVIVVVTALTWVVPMLGIGLVLFVLCDAAINAMRRRAAKPAAGGR